MGTGRPKQSHFYAIIGDPKSEGSPHIDLDRLTKFPGDSGIKILAEKSGA